MPGSRPSSTMQMSVGAPGLPAHACHSELEGREGDVRGYKGCKRMSGDVRGARGAHPKSGDCRAAIDGRHPPKGDARVRLLAVQCADSADPLRLLITGRVLNGSALRGPSKTGLDADLDRVLDVGCQPGHENIPRSGLQVGDGPVVVILEDGPVDARWADGELDLVQFGAIAARAYDARLVVVRQRHLRTEPARPPIPTGFHPD
eukprot:scaffold3265_cov63-Phaeocystis_antarctica.AAC.1